jgi:hypothetical protein
VPDQFGLANEWYARLSEPVRARPRPVLDHFNRNSAFYNYGQIQLFTSWFRPFSEPVRRKAPLAQGAVPHLFFLHNYVEFYLSIVESGDTISFSVASYVAKRKGAYVSIIEITVDLTARVSITDLKDGQGGEN